MATMNISLPSEMRDWVAEQTQTGKYANNSDYVRDLIRKDQERLEAMHTIQVAIAQGMDSGEPKAVSKQEFMARMRTNESGSRS